MNLSINLRIVSCENSFLSPLTLKGFPMKYLYCAFLIMAVYTQRIEAMEPSGKRVVNVMMIGASQSGKSTLGNFLFYNCGNDEPPIILGMKNFF